MDSFMSWIGGKKALRKKIVEQFPEPRTYNRYIEVFGGAGWVLFSSDSHAKMEVYNDVNGNLVNLFRCIKYHPDAVQEELRYILISREQFFDAREQIETRGMTDIQRAARFFILIKESFGTDLRSFGLRSRDMEKAKEYLSEVSKRLNKVVIENLDFEKILKNYDKTDALFYKNHAPFSVGKTGNISRKFLTIILKIFDKNFERLHGKYRVYRYRSRSGQRYRKTGSEIPGETDRSYAGVK